MPSAPTLDIRYVIDASKSRDALEDALAAVAELTFGHDALFSILGDTETITECLSNHPYEAEFVETIHCEGAEQARNILTQLIADDSRCAIATHQLSSELSAALIDADRLLPGIVAPALTAIVPVVKEGGADERDRYCTLLDIEGITWAQHNLAPALVALSEPIARWFSHASPLRIGMLTAGEGTQRSPQQQELLASLEHIASDTYEISGALSPAQMMLGEADLVLNVGEGGAMFVRTLEATFVAAEALVDRETRGVRGRLGLRIFQDRLEKLRDYGNIDSYGGSLLLGIEAPCVVLRPNAGTRAWMNALRILRKMHETDTLGQQRAALQSLQTLRENTP